MASAADTTKTTAPLVEDSTYPALRFERLFGLQNIGQHWAMPGGKTMLGVQDRLWRNVIYFDHDQNPSLAEAKATGNTQKIYKFERGQRYARIFNHLNPALAAIPFDQEDWRHLRGFLHGVVSGFNADDIEDWIHNRTDRAGCEILRKRIAAQFYTPQQESWYPQHLREKFQSRATPCQSLLLAQISWLPGARTIQAINDQLDKKSTRPRAP
jgi:hypothetical protein